MRADPPTRGDAIALQGSDTYFTAAALHRFSAALCLCVEASGVQEGSFIGVPVFLKIGQHRGGGTRGSEMKIPKKNRRYSMLKLVEEGLFEKKAVPVLNYLNFC